jgi:hypothetical protein
VPEHLRLERIALFGQEVERAVELVRASLFGLGQPDPLQPAVMAGKLGAGSFQALQGHRQQRRFIRRVQLLLANVLADRGTDAEPVPQGLGHMGDAEFLHPFDQKIGDVKRLAICSHLADAVVDQDPANTVHQALESGSIELVGTAEAMHHGGLGTSSLRAPDILGERVVFDGRAVAIPTFGGAQVHA